MVGGSPGTLGLLPEAVQRYAPPAPRQLTSYDALKRSGHAAAAAIDMWRRHGNVYDKGSGAAQCNRAADPYQASEFTAAGRAAWAGSEQGLSCWRAPGCWPARRRRALLCSCCASAALLTQQRLSTPKPQARTPCAAPLRPVLPAAGCEGAAGVSAAARALLLCRRADGGVGPASAPGPAALAGG